MTIGSRWARLSSLLRLVAARVADELVGFFPTTRPTASEVRGKIFQMKFGCPKEIEGGLFVGGRLARTSAAFYSVE